MTRVVANLQVTDTTLANDVYTEVFGMDPIMDHGWIVTLGAGAAGAEITYPLTTEPWGVKRFFFRDPFGNLINVLTHDL